MTKAVTSRLLSRSNLPFLVLGGLLFAARCGGGGGGGGEGTGGDASGGSGAGADTGTGADTGAGAEAGTTAQGGEGGEAPVGGDGGTPDQGGATPQGGTTQNGGAAQQGGTPATGGTPAAGSGPCPAAGNCRILALGDGLAAGVGFPNGYRGRMASEMAAFRFEFVGSQTAGTTKHEGMDKRRSAGFADAIPAIMTANTPHIVILTIGAEDALQSLAAATFGTQLGAVIDAINKAAPTAAIVVSTLPPDTDNAYWTRAKTLDAQVATQVKNRETKMEISRGFVQLSFAAEFQPNVVSGTYVSGMSYHPSGLGYNRLGEIYSANILKYLKKKVP